MITNKLKRAVVILLCAVMMLSTSACGCNHEWVEATCTEPKTCSKCGETEGEALGHSWGDWEIETEATVTKAGTKVQTCSQCGATRTESYETETFYADGHLLLNPEDFCTRLTQKLYCQEAVLRENNGEMAAGITGVGGFDPDYEDGEEIAAVFFSDGNVVMGANDKESCTIKILTVKFFTDDQDKIAKTMMGIIETCEGSLDTSEAGNVGKKIVLAAQDGGVYSNDDGVTYGLTKINGAYMFMVTFS